jgi:hypothetical protein
MSIVTKREKPFEKAGFFVYYIADEDAFEQQEAGFLSACG